jgi:hypothetical protein
MRFAALGIMMVVVLNLCAVPPAQARKADTLWTKYCCLYAPVISPDAQVVGARYLKEPVNTDEGFVWWNLRTGAEVWRLRTAFGVSSYMHFTPDGKSVILYNTNGYEKYELGERTRTAFESDGDTNGVGSGYTHFNDLSPDGTVFVSTRESLKYPGQISDSLTFWDVQSGRIVKACVALGLRGANPNDVMVYFSSQNNQLFIRMPNEQRIFQWHRFDVSTGKLTPLPYYSRNVYFSQDRTRIAAFVQTGIEILDGTMVQVIATLPAGMYNSTAAFTMDNSQFFAVGKPGILVWDISTTRCLDTVPFYVTDMSISNDGRYIAGGPESILLIDRMIDTAVSSISERATAPLLYPNPSTLRVHIRTSMAMLPGFAMDVIASAGGRSIELEPTALQRTPDELIVDVSSLPVGTYLFRLHSPGSAPETVNVIINR